MSEPDRDDPAREAPDRVVPAADDGPGRRARFERSRLGQSLITYGLLLALVVLVLQNLPASVVRKDLSSIDSAARSIGYEQDWAVFSPDPRSENFRVYATLTYPDGSTERWDVPKGNPLIDAYDDYRWQKFQERLRTDQYTGLYQPLCRWLAATHTRGGHHPVKVVLTRRFEPVLPIGQPQPVTPPVWTSQDVFTYRPGP